MQLVKTASSSSEPKSNGMTLTCTYKLWHRVACAKFGLLLRIRHAFYARGIARRHKAITLALLTTILYWSRKALSTRCTHRKPSFLDTAVELFAIEAISKETVSLPRTFFHDPGERTVIIIVISCTSLGNIGHVLIAAPCWLNHIRYNRKIKDMLLGRRYRYNRKVEDALFGRRETIKPHARTSILLNGGRIENLGSIAKVWVRHASSIIVAVDPEKLP